MGRDSTGNHLIHFNNGNKYCNRCGYKEIIRKETVLIDEINNLPKGGDIPERKLLSKFTELYGLKIEHDTATGGHKAYYAPLYEVGTGELMGYQRRLLPKTFSYVGKIRGRPWQFSGQNLVRERGKFLIIVEGYLDTIAAKQMLSAERKSWSVVGVMSTSVERQVRDNIEWLNGFDTIVLALDQDTAANKSIETIVGLLPPEKIKIATYSENDPCDMLIKDKGAEFVNALTAAKGYTPKGIVNASDVLDDFLSLKDQPFVSFPPEWVSVNNKTGGMRFGEIIVYTAGTGIGKSQFCDEVVAHLLHTEPETKMGILKMEHNNAVGLQSILSVHMKANLKKYRSEFTDKELTKEWNELFGSDRAYLVDHGFSGVGSDSSFIGKLVGLIVSAGCTDIIIDHLHAVISDSGSDNEDVDSIMYSLQRLAQMYQIRLHIVMHLRKTGVGGKSFETGEMPTLDDLKGSGALKQVPDTIIAVARNTQHEDDYQRRVATLAVIKNRWLGDTGIADKLIFDPDESKYYVHDDEEEEKNDVKMMGI